MNHYSYSSTISNSNNTTSNNNNISNSNTITTSNRNSDFHLDPPIDFNPSLYPTKKRKVLLDNSVAVVSNCRYSSNNRDSSSSNRKMSNRRKSSKGSKSSSGKSSFVNAQAIDEMFNEMAEENDPNIATMQGLCTMGEKLNIDPFEDIRMLVLLHKLGANEKPGQISREEWKKGCEKLSTDSWDKLKEILPSLETGFMMDNEFRDFHKFCFQFNRQGTHKTLEKDLVIALVGMTLKDRIDNERLSTFIEFLNQTKEASYNTITLDQWMSFFDFSKECPDLNDHDEDNSAWPVLIDDFVEYATSMQM